MTKGAPLQWAVVAAKNASEVLHIDGHDVAVSNPTKVLFPEAGYTKLDVVRYYLTVADGALRAAGDVPTSSSAIPTASTASISIKSAHLNRGPTGLKSSS
jgi:hypothetical protein